MSSAPETLLGRVVVIDLDGPWVALGTLRAWTANGAELTDADLHDLTEGSSTRDVYALETQRFGVRVNRRRLWLPAGRVIAVSPLDDITA